MAISTLGEFAQGRVILNVSVGNILNLGESGIEPLKPIRIMREYVEALRALWAGAPVTHEGELHKLRGAKMVFDQGRQYPIYVASTGPQMLKLAGEIADGVLLSAGLRLASTRRCLVLAHAGVAAKGRDPAALRRCSFINCNVSEDRMAARAAMLRKLSFLFRSRGHADNIKSSNLDIDHQAIMASHARHDFDGAVRLLPVEAANIFAVAGTPAHVGPAWRVSGHGARRTRHRGLGHCPRAQAGARCRTRHQERHRHRPGAARGSQRRRSRSDEADHRDGDPDIRSPTPELASIYRPDYLPPRAELRLQ